MGLLVDGKWHDKWYDTESSKGEFIREDAQFRNQLTADGADGSFPAAKDRYHLFVSLACPWAHRTLIFRKLKQLEDYIGVTVVKPEMLQHGWELQQQTPLGQLDYLHQVYTAAKPDYSGRVTVPILWDKQTKQIVNNESAEIIRFFNSAFNHLTGNDADFYPKPLRDDIDSINSFVYKNVNNGVYRAGFATTQSAYEQAFQQLFDALDLLEKRLSKQRYLLGSQLTEADWRLFTTLIRFDSVYVGHFKCNKQRIEDYPNLSNYLRDLYQHPGIAETVDFGHIKTHYYYSHGQINPTRIVPVGPNIDYNRPHNRSFL